MANQSLKEQIEAAKSALARGAVRAMPTVELPTAPLPVAQPQASDRMPARPTTLATSPATLAVAEKVSDNHDDMSALADRITLLEDQLASNQRDLQTLIRKIREITRAQQHGGSATGAKPGHAARRKWSKIIYIIIAIAAGSAIAATYVLKPNQIGVFTADLHALFSGVVEQLGWLIGLE